MLARRCCDGLAQRRGLNFVCEPDVPRCWCVITTKTDSGTDNVNDTVVLMRMTMFMMLEMTMTMSMAQTRVFSLLFLCLIWREAILSVAFPSQRRGYFHNGEPRLIGRQQIQWVDSTILLDIVHDRHLACVCRRIMRDDLMRLNDAFNPLAWLQASHHIDTIRCRAAARSNSHCLLHIRSLVNEIFFLQVQDSTSASRAAVASFCIIVSDIGITHVTWKWTPQRVPMTFAVHVFVKLYCFGSWCRGFS